MTTIVEFILSKIKNGANALTIIFVLLSFITYVAAQDAVMAIAPIVVYTIGASAGLTLIIATIGFVVIRYETLATKRSELRRDRKIFNSEGEQAELNIIFQRELMGAQIGQIRQNLIHMTEAGEVKFKQFSTSVIKEYGGDVPLLETQQAPLLPAIANCDNVLIVGGKGSGKTTLLQWIEAERLQSGQTIIMDSHSQPGQWQGKVIGASRNYTMIKNAMLALNGMLDDRYKKYSVGQSNFEPVNQIIDEFTLLPDKLKSLNFNVQDYSKSQLTEGRKVVMNCLWGIHSDRVTALGLKGASDLKECFDAVVYLKNVNGERYAICDFGEGKQDTRYLHPGPFVTHQTALIDAPPTIDDIQFVVAPEPEPEPEPTGDELAIIEATEQIRKDHGKVVFSRVCKLLDWTPGGPNYSRIKAILDRWDISY